MVSSYLPSLKFLASKMLRIYMLKENEMVMQLLTRQNQFRVLNVLVPPA